MIQENTLAKVELLEMILASSGVLFVIPAYQCNYSCESSREIRWNSLKNNSKPIEIEGIRNSH